MLLIFSLYGFYKHVHITVLSFACLWDLVLLFLCIFSHSVLASDWTFVLFIVCVSFIGHSEAIAEEKRKTKRKKSNS